MYKTKGKESQNKKKKKNDNHPFFLPLLSICSRLPLLSFLLATLNDLIQLPLISSMMILQVIREGQRPVPRGLLRCLASSRLKFLQMNFKGWSHSFLFGSSSLSFFLFVFPSHVMERKILVLMARRIWR